MREKDYLIKRVKASIQIEQASHFDGDDAKEEEEERRTKEIVLMGKIRIIDHGSSDLNSVDSEGQRCLMLYRHTMNDDDDDVE
jgi:hypothetical protein